MNFWGRLKGTPGGGNQIPTLASTTNLWLPDDVSVAFISGTTQIDFIYTPNIRPGRQVIFLGVTTTGPAFKNVNDTTTSGGMDLGGSNRTIAPNDVLCLMQKADGSWLMQYTTNN